MYLSFNWLKEFVKLKQSPEQVAEVLTHAGFEVEKIDYWGKGLENVLVGQIKTIVSHAEADKLSVCKVDVGRAKLMNIVCAAKNIKPGQKVPVALIDAVLPSGIRIERRRIRGIDSEGMLCAEDELGLGDDHRGILILDKDLKVGKKFGQAIGLEDIVLDITVSPNRADGFSVLGLAREFAALSGQKLVHKKVEVKESKKHSIKKLLSVRIADYDLCPKYTARVVSNVKVKQSPEWLKSRLLVAGIKPINNIVDISNYVMLEMGQPLHTFDMAKVKGRKIVVRKAGKDKKFVTLDREERKLASDMLVIADSKEPIAVAGVIGGKNSEISRETKDVVIESAIFKPISIRKTRQKLGLITEASTRFEKGIWWDLPEAAADRAAQLMQELASGEVAKGIIIASKVKTYKPTTIKVSLDYTNKLIGRNFTETEVIKNLEKLNFTVAKAGKDEIKVTVPSWRQDVKIPADVVEEIGRMYGWNNLKSAPIYAELKPVSLTPEQQVQKKIKDILVACGMTEVLNYSFYGKSLIDQFGLDIKKHYKVENPLNPEQEYLRTSLVPRLFENLMKNYQGKSKVDLFEVGTVFNKTAQGMPEEKTMLAGIVYQKGDSGFRGEKGKSVIISALCRGLNINDSSVIYSPIEGELKPEVGININGVIVGEMGHVQINIQKLKGLPFWFEIDLLKLISVAEKKREYKPLADYPSVERDMSFVVLAEEVSYQDIARLIKNIDPLIVAVQPLRLHKISDHKRSATFRIIYQAPGRTLKSEEVEEIEKRIIREMFNKFKAELKK